MIKKKKKMVRVNWRVFDTQNQIIKKIAAKSGVGVSEADTARHILDLGIQTFNELNKNKKNV